MADARQTALDLFAEEFSGSPEFVVRSPGRVNLIGDHTDYNDGFVLPMAIDRHVWLAGRRRTDRRVSMLSAGFPPVDLDLDALGPSDSGWGEYVAGVAWSLSMGLDPLSGWEGAMASDVPVGAGLSSSAALELAVAMAFSHVAGLAWDPVAMALAAQRAENEWVGMACGIMDQLVVAAADPDNALLIDCRSLASQAVPIPDGVSVLVVDSGTRRSLVESAYNERRAACEEASRLLGVAALRDADAGLLVASNLPEVVARRARHVISENARVLDVADALRAGDASRAGQAMNASHQSLAADYEVSTSALDRLVDLLHQQPGVFGARMTGAGFGGCVVALVDHESTATVVDATLDGARRAGLEEVAAYRTRPVAGTSVQDVSS